MYLHRETIWEEGPKLGKDFLPLFDEAMPMNECWSEYLHTLADLYEALDDYPRPPVSYLWDPETKEENQEMVNTILSELCSSLNISLEQVDMHDESILVDFWYKRHRAKMEALVEMMGAECKTLEEFAWYPLASWISGERMRNKWTWTLGEPDERGKRVVEDTHEWIERDDEDDRTTRMVIFVGEAAGLVERWERRARGFNPYKVYWPL